MNVITRRALVLGCTAWTAAAPIAQVASAQGYPAKPIRIVVPYAAGGPISTTINGQPREFASGQDKTLLRLLREDAGLAGRDGVADPNSTVKDGTAGSCRRRAGQWVRTARAARRPAGRKAAADLGARRIRSRGAWRGVGRGRR